MPEPKTVNIPPSELNDGQRKDILEAYKANLTVRDICETWNIATTTLYDIVRKAGVPLRSDVNRPRPQFAPVPPPRRRTPPPPRRRPVMPQSTAPVSTPAVEPAPTNGVVSGLTEWLVTYTVTRTETVTVAAKDFNSAAASVTEGDVISVAKKPAP